MNPTTSTSSSAPAAASGLVGRRWRALWHGLILLWIVLAGGLLLLRYGGPILVGHYQTELVNRVGEALGAELSVGRIELDWQGWRPQLRLQQVRLGAEAGTQAFSLDHIDAGLSLAGWWRGELHFKQIEIGGAQLTLVREPDGRIHVAGFVTDEGETDHAALGWLLAQSEIRLIDAALVWEDHLRAAPRLLLSGLELRLASAGQHAELSLSGRLPAGLGENFELRAVFEREVAPRLGAERLPVGEFFVRLDHAGLRNWQPWLALPAELNAQTSVQAWIRTDVAGKLDARLELEIAEADGAPLLAPLALEASLDPSRPQDEGRVSFALLDLAALHRLAMHFPLSEAWQQALAVLSPQGRIEQASFAWRNIDTESPGWQLNARLRALRLAPWEQWPGVSGLNVDLAGNEQQGRFQLDGSALALDLPQVFSAGPIVLDQLQAVGHWQALAQGWEFRLDEASLNNADLEGSASGAYRTASAGAGQIELEAALTRARGEAVWRYLPRVAGEQTQQWVHEAVRTATVNSAKLRLRGELADFPFRDGNGEFRVDVVLEDGVLAYAQGWPQIEQIAATLNFVGPGLRIEAEQAQIFGVGLAKVVVDIPELDTHVSDRMTISGEARGPTAEFLRFITASPVSASIDGMTDHMKASGSGELKLRLTMPLLDLERSRVAGEYRFRGNQLQVLDALPVLTNASGELRFTERGIQIPQARAQFLGGETRLVARSSGDGVLDFELTGEAELEALQALAQQGRSEEHAAAGSLLKDQLGGRLQWAGELKIARKRWQLGLESDLIGVQSLLPAPLGKRAEQRWPLRLDLQVGTESEEAGADQRLGLNVALDEGVALDVRAQWSAQQPLQAAVAVGRRVHSPALPARGLAFRLELDELDGEAWRALADAGEESSGLNEALLPLRGDLVVTRLPGLGVDLEKVKAGFSVTAHGWEAELDSDRIAGKFSWLDSGSGALHARLDKLIVGDARAQDPADPALGSAAAEEDDIEPPPRKLPALDVIAERFVLRDMELGRLELAARNRSGLWLLDEFSIANEDARLQGSGHWRTIGDPRSELDFRLEVANIGRFSRRLGQDDVIRGGKAVLTGELGWRGGPTHLHYPSLGGRFSLRAEAGQFNKLEPGVGRLLGILSLQALPRRITLDFRDVFSSGFAFDGISGSMSVDKGVVRSENFAIHGPAARINMQGWADLKTETQELRVLVLPTLSESVALGAAATLVNPVAGVLAYLAQKALSDPIEKLFAYEYEISGGWADPVVQRIGRASAERP